MVNVYGSIIDFNPLPSIPFQQYFLVMHPLWFQDFYRVVPRKESATISWGQMCISIVTKLFFSYRPKKAFHEITIESFLTPFLFILFTEFWGCKVHFTMIYCKAQLPRDLPIRIYKTTDNPNEPFRFFCLIAAPNKCTCPILKFSYQSMERQNQTHNYIMDQNV